MLLLLAVLLGIIGLLFISSLLALYKFLGETRKMVPLPTGRLIEGIYAVKNSYVNFFLIAKNNQLIAIDAGVNCKLAGSEMKKLNLDPEKVAAVFLTHSDADHVAATPLFKNAEVYLAADEEQLINGKTHRRLIFNNTLSRKHQLLSDNMVVNIHDIKVQAIATPGHTPGSMSYLVDDQYLFTGDLLSLQQGKAQLFNRFFNMNSEAQKKSLIKLKNYFLVKYLITAHYGSTSDPATALSTW